MPNKKPSKTATTENKNEDKTEELEKISEKEFEKQVVALAKTGLTAEKIGEELKKQKIHSKEYPRKISQILKEKNLYVLPDLKNLEEQFEKVEKHSKKNKQDKRALREKSRIFSQIRKIKKYHQIEQ